MVTSTQLLAQQIEHLRRQINAVQQTPQLPYSAIDNGVITVTSNGSTTGYVGVQYDGTTGAVAVSGPKPPKPSVPTLTQVIGGVKVHWDGTFVDPQPGWPSPVVAPLDFAAVDVQVSADVNFGDTGFGPTHGAIVSAQGGEVFVAWHDSNTPLYARLVTRSKAGKYSDPSLTAGPVNSGQVQIGDIGFPIAQYSGGNTVYYTVSPATPTAPSWGFTPGDLWLEQTATATGLAGGAPSGTPLYQTSRWGGSTWVQLQDQGINDSLAAAITAQQTANGRAKLFTGSTMPSYSGASGTAYWISGPDNVPQVWNGSTWIPYLLGNGAIQPNSLVASNVIATGTISAALLEATMVLATSIVAGTLTGTHAAMEPDGFHVYDSNGNEIIRLGVSSSNDYFGIVDSSGVLVASIDDTGQANLQGLNVKTEPIFQGSSLSSLIQSESPGVVGYFECNVPAQTGYSDYGPITNRVGILECNAMLVAGRRYSIRFKSTWFALNDPAECRYHVQYSTPSAAGSSTAPTPTLSSPEVDYFLFPSNYSGGWQTAVGECTFVPTTSGRHRFLLAIELGGAPGQPSNAQVWVVSAVKNIMEITDTGFNQPLTGVQTQAGGSFYQGPPPPPPPPPTQQYDTGEIGPAGHWTFRGNGSLRTDTSDVVQGWDPSGYNGDGKGGWNFNVPNITGTVNRVDLYIYNNWAYYNSGGQALISLANDASNLSTYPGRGGEWNPGATYPKPGAVTVTLPSSWYGYFKNRSFIGVCLGPSGGSNETYYIRADGPSARLRIWYTQ